MGNDSSSSKRRVFRIRTLSGTESPKNKPTNVINTNLESNKNEPKLTIKASDTTAIDKQLHITLSSPSVQQSSTPQYFVSNNVTVILSPNYQYFQTKKQESNNNNLSPPQNPVSASDVYDSDFSDLDPHNRHSSTNSFSGLSISCPTDVSTNRYNYQHNDDMTHISTNNSHKGSIQNMKCKSMNGITDKYISLAMLHIIRDFWTNNIETQTTQKQLEIGCAIYFELIEMDTVFKARYKIKDCATHILNALRTVFKYLLRSDMNLFAFVTQFDFENQKRFLTMQHISVICKAINKTFSYYFDREYVVQVKYCMEYVLTVLGYITLFEGETDDLTFECHVKEELLNRFNKKDFDVTLKKCLESSYFGREYLYHYIHQSSCDELVLFLKTYFIYKSKPTQKEQLMIIQQIIKQFIETNAVYSLNISFECRQNILDAIVAVNAAFQNKETLDCLPNDFFRECYCETLRLINGCFWNKFVRTMRKMQRLIIFNDAYEICTTPSPSPMSLSPNTARTL